MKTRSRGVAAAAVLAALMLWPLGVGATTVYNNLAATNAGPDQISSNIDGPLGASFSSIAGPSTLSDVKLLLEGTPSDGGTITVSLFSDAGNTPGSSLATLGTIPVTSLSPASSTLDLSGLSTPLNASTRYWIELSLSTPSNSSAAWEFANDSSGTGVANEFFYSAGSAVSNLTSGVPFQMSVDVTPVPEAATGLAVAIGMCGVGLLAARRRRRPVA